MKPIFTNKDLRLLIVPLILEQALAITVGMADTMMVSSVGEVAVSGVSLVDMLNNLIFNILAALATGGCVIVSQFIGASEEKKARNAAAQLLVTVLASGILVTVAVLAFRRQLLRLFFGKIEQDVMDAALLYLTISAFSFPFLGIYNASAALFRSMGRTDLTFRVSVIGNLINVGGNALCVFVFRMGVAGVALPTLISRILMALMLFVLLRKPNQTVYLEKTPFRLNWSLIRKILYIGIPGGIENGVFQLGRLLVVSIISGFGTVQIAANGVANTLDNVGIIAAQAINLAMVTVIGRCVGAGDKDQIRYYWKKLIAISYIALLIINIPLFLFLNPILSLFSLSAETEALTRILVIIHNGVGLFLWPMSFVFPNMLRACNDVTAPMICSILSMWIFRLGFSLLLGVHYGWGAIGVWIAMVLDWICRITCFVIRYLRGNWQKTMYKMKE